MLDLIEIMRFFCSVHAAKVRVEVTCGHYGVSTDWVEVKKVRFLSITIREKNIQRDLGVSSCY